MRKSRKILEPLPLGDSCTRNQTKKDQNYICFDCDHSLQQSIYLFTHTTHALLGTVAHRQGSEQTWTVVNYTWWTDTTMPSETNYFLAVSNFQAKETLCCCMSKDGARLFHQHVFCKWGERDNGDLTAILSGLRSKFLNHAVVTVTLCVSGRRTADPLVLS